MRRRSRQGPWPGRRAARDQAFHELPGWGTRERTRHAAGWAHSPRSDSRAGRAEGHGPRMPLGRPGRRSWRRGLRATQRVQATLHTRRRGPAGSRFAWMRMVIFVPTLTIFVAVENPLRVLPTALSLEMATATRSGPDLMKKAALAAGVQMGLLVGARGEGVS